MTVLLDKGTSQLGASQPAPREWSCGNRLELHERNYSRTKGLELQISPICHTPQSGDFAMLMGMSGTWNIAFRIMSH